MSCQRIRGVTLKNTIEHIVKLRNEYGVTQPKLALLSGISWRQLQRYEAGRSKLKESVAETLITTLERLNPNKPMEIIFDYIRIRFNTNDVDKVIEQYLKIKVDYFGVNEHGFYGYEKTYFLGDVFVMSSSTEELGVMLELKGKGCRQFESYLEAQGRTWYTFFTQVLENNFAVVKRLDIAINDKTGILDIPFLSRKCDAGECISVFKAYKSYSSGEMIKHREENVQDMGHTLYIGSLRSEVYFCIYEKNYEEFVKMGVPMEDAEVKNRFEIRLKNDRAYKAIIDLLTYEDAEKTAFSIINRYVRFADADEELDRESWKNNPMWDYFIGENRRAIRLTTKPEPYTLDKTLRWIHKQVASTFKMAQEIDRINGTSNIEKILENAELNEKHQKIIEQNTFLIEEVVN